jgi:hypothetical protein
MWQVARKCPNFPQYPKLEALMVSEISYSLHLLKLYRKTLMNTASLCANQRLQQAHNVDSSDSFERSIVHSFTLTRGTAYLL